MLTRWRWTCREQRTRLFATRSRRKQLCIRNELRWWRGCIVSRSRIRVDGGCRGINPPLFRLSSGRNSAHLHVYDCLQSVLLWKINSDLKTCPKCTKCHNIDQVVSFYLCCCLSADDKTVLFFPPTFMNALKEIFEICFCRHNCRSLMLMQDTMKILT